ncbi:MAG TPA: histidine phosphatase family protein [Anaerolineales bacterium]
MTHQITLLRHGLSLGNDQGVRQGQQEYPLTEIGRRQASALAVRWSTQSVTFDAIISSPLARAWETATILQQALDSPMEADERWMERSSGIAEGKPIELETTTRIMVDPVPAHLPLFEYGESELDLFTRAVSALQSVLRRPAGDYLIVSHGAILGAALRSVLGLAPTGALPLARFSFDNTGFAVVAYASERGHWRVERLNDTCHLQGTA